MTLDEIFKRVVRAHLLLLLVCLVVPVSVVAYHETNTAPEWIATVRMQVAAKAPSSPTEADALSARVLALATTPYLVKQALEENHLVGDPATLVQQDITSQRLGESPVVELSVRNPDRAVARQQVQAISGRVVTFMNDGNQRAFRLQLSTVQAQLAAAVATRDRAVRQIAGQKTPRPLDQAELADAQAAVDRLNATVAQLEVTDATRDLVVLINGTEPQLDRTGSQLIPRGALAVILGLLLGVSLAVLLETLRPRTAGPRSVARALGAPVIPAGGRPASALHQTLTLACRRQGVDTVAVVGVDGASERLAHRLLRQLESVDAELREHASEHANERVGARYGEDDDLIRDPTPGRIRFCALGEVETYEELTAGLLVACSGSPLQRDVDSVADIVQTTRWPVVGIVDGSSDVPRSRR